MENLEISGNKQTNESDHLLQSSKQKFNLKTLHWIIICIILMMVTALATNMDRIISSFETSTQDKYDSYDIIIVGAGPTGLLNANLLKDAYPNKNILILEQLNRVGGRQFSSKVVSSINNDTIIFDYCAFRTKPTHYTMKVLDYLDICDELYLFDEYFVSNSSYTLSETRDYKILNKNINISYWSNLYNLNQNDIDLLTIFGDADNALIPVSFQEIVIENGGVIPETGAEWVLFRNNWTYQGIPLNKWAFSTMIKSMNTFSSEFLASSESINFAKGVQTGYWLSLRVSGNFPSVANHSSYYMLKNGYDKMSKSLYDKIKNDVTLKFENKVISINKQSRNKYIVETINNDKYKCNDIILSIPIDNIKELLPNIEVLKDDSNLINILNHMDSGVASKIILIYDTLLFTENAINILNKITRSSSRSTDIGDIYFTQNNTLCYLMIYPVNSDSSDFWWNLQQATNNDLYEINNSIFIEGVNDSTIASQEVVNQMTTKLNNLLDVFNITIPMPMAAFASFWGKDISFGAGVAFPLSGLNVDIAIQNSLKPNNNENIYISISDFSLTTNVVEGGFWNAIQNVMRNFDIQNDPLEQYEGCL